MHTCCASSSGSVSSSTVKQEKIPPGTFERGLSALRPTNSGAYSPGGLIDRPLLTALPQCPSCSPIRTTIRQVAGEARAPENHVHVCRRVSSQAAARSQHHIRPPRRWVGGFVPCQTCRCGIKNRQRRKLEAMQKAREEAERKAREEPDLVCMAVEAL